MGWWSSEKHCKGCQYFSEICRISENDWQLIPPFSKDVLQQRKRFSIFWRTTDPVVNPSRGFLEPYEGLVLNASILKIAAKIKGAP
jgi:hypothetical protein